MCKEYRAFPGGTVGKGSTCQCRKTWVRSLGWENPLEEEMANPLQYSCLENPTDRGAWSPTVHGIARSQTRLSVHPHKEYKKEVSLVMQEGQECNVYSIKLMTTV